MDFNKPINRLGTNSTKWDMMEHYCDVPRENGLAMWTADSDFATAPCVIEAVRKAADLGIFGYSWEYPNYQKAIRWWMKTRHNWEIETDWIMTAQGLGNAISLSLDVWSDPGDRIVIFSPVYHEFALKIRKAGREVVECPLARSEDTYVLDLEDAQNRLTGAERILIWCSPQNPSGRIWTAEELRSVAAFADRNDLILISDEVHHDLVYPGHTFVSMDVASPETRNRSVYMTSASKTFNIAGQRTGNMIIPDPELRSDMRKRLNSLDYKPSALGVAMIEAAYSPDGANWVDAQIAHLDANRQLFDAAVNAIPGVRSLPLQSTFLAWVDFEGTGMTPKEIASRIRDRAKIAVSQGPGFGAGGELFQRFNLATQKSRVEDACARLSAAFGDLQ
jgi:cysteine-S-conjugate beta-lyase